MTIHSIQLVRPPLGFQLAAFTAGAILAAQYPELPGGYTIVHNVYPDRVDILLEDLSAVEIWRDALDVDPSDLELTNFAAREIKLEFHTVITAETPVDVRVYAVDLAPALADDTMPLTPQPAETAVPA